MNNTFPKDMVTDLITAQWSSLANLNTRKRVLIEHPLKLYVSKSSEGNRVFIFELEKVHQQIDPPEFKALKTVVTDIDGHQEVTFELQNGDYSDVFDSFLFDLVTQSAQHDPLTACAVIVNRILRWTELFKRMSGDGLSEDEIIGLLGELLVVDQLIEKGFDDSLVIRGWRGPEGDATDIGLEGFRIEVKTKRSTQHSFVEISSADQLRLDGKDLFLTRILLTPSEDSGHSLRDLVEQVSQRLKDKNRPLTELNHKLSLVGYTDNQKENTNRYELVREDWFEVRDNFPRIDPDQIPSEITKVRYRLELDQLDEYLIQPENALKRFRDDGSRSE